MNPNIELKSTYGFHVGKASYLSDEDVNFVQKKDVYQLLWLYKGKVTVTIANNKKELQEGDCLFFGKNELFRLTADQTYTLLYVQFTEAFYCRTELDRFFLSKCTFFDNTKSINYINVKTEHEVFVQSYFNTLYKIDVKPYSDINYMLAHNTIERVLLFLISAHIESLDSFNHSKLTPLQLEIAVAFTKLLSKYAKRERNVQFYVDQLNLNMAKLTEVCKEVYGVTPKKIIASSVVNEAKLLLKHTPLAVKEVAYELNFEDASNFIRFFIKATGLSPKEYRESL